MRLPRVTPPQVIIPGRKESPRGYVRSGLVFHLDGINKGTNPDVWTDLIGGKDFVKVSSNTIFGEKSVLGAVKSEGFVNVLGKDGTIEVCYKNTTSIGTGASLFWQKDDSVINAVYNKTSSFPSAVVICYNPVLDPATPGAIFANTYLDTGLRNPGAHTISLSKLMGFHNFSAMNKTTPRALTLSGTANTSAYVGYNGIETYSVRIYNRHLTANEILNNQRTDAKRFQLEFSEAAATMELYDDYYYGDDSDPF